MYPRKYVIVRVNELELVILFDAILEHRQFCDSRQKPAGAGFYDAHSEQGKIKVVCYGHSETLKCKSRGEIDAKLIERHFERN